jgi:hypothetical protein
VIRTKLIPKHPDDDPGFGEEGSDYLSIDNKLTAHAPILGEDANKNNEKDDLEISGPWHPTFASDARKVWSMLLAFFTGNRSWQHVKKHQQTQNGQKAWMTLHDNFFGGNKATTLYQGCIARLAAYRFD